jgi:Putative DNA-binding domain
VALPIDSSRPIRTRAEQVALVEAVRDAPASEQETNSLEWKGSLDLTSRRDLTKIVKTVVGFANRQPDEAARTFSGCAYLLVGIEPGVLAGVQAVDAAKLESGLTPYIGPMIQWRPDYVEVDGKTVLVVAVEPPQAGDPLHAVRKSFSDGKGELLRDGDVFVRHQASTDPAKYGDIEALSRRAAISTGEDLDMSLRVLDGEPLARTDLREQTIEEFLYKQEHILLSSLPQGVGGTQSVSAFTVVTGDYRSPTDYREEVNEYLFKLQEALLDVLPARSVMHDVGRVQLGIANDKDHSWTNVRVELSVPKGVIVDVWKPDQEQKKHELPKPPRPFGTSSVGQRSFAGLGKVHFPEVIPFSVPEIEETASETKVIFRDQDVRAEGTAPLRNIWLLADDQTPEKIVINWEATADNATKRLKGTIEIAVSDQYVAPAHLLDKPPD